MKLLRALVIILLFSILGMQIYFLLTKKSAKSIIKSGVEESINTTQPDTIQTVTQIQPKAEKDTPTPKPVAKKTTINQSKKGYTVEAAKCIGCNLCIGNCPVSAITSVNGVAVIDKDKCISCGICKNGDNAEFAGCPVGAISIK